MKKLFIALFFLFGISFNQSCSLFDECDGSRYQIQTVQVSTTDPNITYYWARVFSNCAAWKGVGSFWIQAPTGTLNLSEVYWKQDLQKYTIVSGPK